MAAPKGNQYAKGSLTNGRPRTTLKDLPENWKEIVLEIGKGGEGRSEIQCQLGLTNRTFKTLMDNEQDFRETVENANVLSQSWYEKQVKRLIEGGEGNSQMLKFALINKFKDDWSEKSEQTITTNVIPAAPTYKIVEE